MTELVPAKTIQRKRDGATLSEAEIRSFFSGYAAGRVPEYAMASLLMAIFFRGLAREELDVLVDVMLHSGVVLDLSDIPARKVDKHSTGGVGDKTSLVLAPLLASLGVCVPMLSGRGLGHTGGTLDKLEAIPGFRTNLSLKEFRAQLERIGCAMIGQTEEIAPLDRRLYALRDVTGTVEAIPLISSSIMSKKLAEGLDGLVLDVKRGSGAFLPELDRALELARLMVSICAGRSCDVVALLTAMDRPLGYAVGNALETEEAMFALRGEGPADLRELVVALAAEMALLGRVAPTLAAARDAVTAALDDGRALERMRVLVEAQGGNPAVVDDPALLPQAPVRRTLESDADGWIQTMDTRAIGLAALAIGAGRRTLDSRIDPAVGFQITARPGDRVERGAPLATVFAASTDDAEEALAALRDAIAIAESPPAHTPLPLISHRVTAEGVEELSPAN